MASPHSSPHSSAPGAGTGLEHPGWNDPVAALEHFEMSVNGFRTGMTEIEGSPSYLMLQDASSTGETARRYGTAARDAQDLWLLIEAAGEQLAAARNHVAANGTSGAAGAELRALLQERWYTLTLPGKPAKNYSVRDVLAEVRRRYEAIRAGVTEIDQLWVSVLPRVDAARATLDRLQGEADQLGVLEPLIGRARALADDLAERLISDPASVSAQDGANLDIQVAKAAKQMAGLRTAHDDLDADLNATEELLASLRVLRARAEAARVEAMTKIVDPEGLVRLPGEALLDGPDGMASRLDRLFESAATAAWTQKRTMLDTWLTSARKLEAQFLRAEATNRASIEARNELRGRLQAYSAKVAATGRAEDLELADLVDRAQALLYTAPTDLDQAEEAIADLATKLRA